MIRFKNTKLVYVSLFALSITACGIPTPREANIAQRQKMIDSFDDKLATLKLALEESKEKLANAPHDARLKYQAEFDALNKHYQRASEMQEHMKTKMADAADDAWEDAKQGMDKISEELAALQKDIRDTDRQEIIRAFEKKLADLELKIQDGKKKIANASEELRLKFNTQLAALDLKRQEAQDKVSELKKIAQDGASDVWQKVKAGLDTAWDNIQAAGHALVGSN